MEDPVPISAASDELLDELLTANQRQPVRNHEERVELGPLLRAGLWRRDGGHCWICEERVYGVQVADHIVPRSSFTPETVWLADRSDNLALAHWYCNENRSNRSYIRPAPLGITTECFECAEWLAEYADESGLTTKCFCMNCGMSGVTLGEYRFLRAGDE